MYGLRSVRRRHVFLIFATIFLVIFLTNNTNAVHRLRRLDIESIDWSNYEEDIISHVKEELNSIVENPEDFLESKKDRRDRREN
ncbi:Oidioi.mRNA.OKI2018_I69.PAR.g10046.t1.cds [Oikopleura dioica]|uniref:Oidioi.mRNA.OKI2018_I69.PAR.g10046.t1.cds n=1 Tax=Oikopleura dioica TaxID=34765 RepID=A0ABN7RNQ1_OIKDI|nr:Oidioi.mRNA.OKI2018_I69.PAR.g10046.t1.cds [Oikopleura dioica]